MQIELLIIKENKRYNFEATQYIIIVLIAIQMCLTVETQTYNFSCIFKMNGARFSPNYGQLPKLITRCLFGLGLAPPLMWAYYQLILP